MPSCEYVVCTNFSTQSCWIHQRRMKCVCLRAALINAICSLRSALHRLIKSWDNIFVKYKRSYSQILLKANRLGEKLIGVWFIVLKRTKGHNIVFTFCCRLKWRELHLPAELQPGFIFQTQLESLLDCKVSSDRHDKAFKSLPGSCFIWFHFSA